MAGLSPEDRIMLALGALGRVREFVESEVENRSYAGGMMTDYESEADEALAELDATIALLEPLQASEPAQ